MSDSDHFDKGVQQVQEYQITKLICTMLIAGITIICLTSVGCEYLNYQKDAIHIQAGMCKQWNAGGWHEYKKCA
jgi:hypothetical protein